MTRPGAFILGVVALALAACGGAPRTPVQTDDPTPTAPAAATPTASAAATSVPGALAFTVASGSKAVVRVTEQLADRRDLSEAVLTSEKAGGSFTLLPDGRFAPGSKIDVDLNALSSDNGLRDNTVRRFVLETSRYPQATFVPTGVAGLALPLAASGDLVFTVSGEMTVHGVTKDVTFSVTATRSGPDLTATATLTPAIRFGTFGMQQPRVPTVISIKDEIRLEVHLVAKQQPGV